LWQSNVTGNTIFNNEDGLSVYSSGENIIKENIIDSNNRWGIGIINSYRDKIIDNQISSNGGYGIYISSSSDLTVSGNTMVNDGIFIRGPELSHWNTHNIDTSNTVNGKPVYYWKNQTGGVVPPGGGQVILANCSNVSVTGHEFKFGTVGIELGYSSNCKIKGNDVSQNDAYGIYISNSYGNNIFGNEASYTGVGITIRGSGWNNITGNTVSYNSFGGIALSGTNNNIITGNSVSSNDNYGIYLDGATYNEIMINSISDNLYGLYVKYWSTFNEIMINSISDNVNGIYIIDNSTDNGIYHNNIMANINQAYDDHWDNNWDNGYPSGGNYWSDYIGVDLNSTPSQDVPPPDGIGDTPYIIDLNSQDNYPLMESYVPPPPPSPPLLPPILYINTSSDGKDIVLNWEPQTIQDFDPYLIYRSTDPTNFDFSIPWINTLTDKEPGELAPIPDRTTWNDTNAAYPGDITNFEEQYYYVMRAFNSNGEISSTSRTVGKWTKSFPEGISTFSLPLEPIEPLDTDYYTTSMNAEYIKYMDSGSHTWRKHEYGDLTTNNTIMKLGEGYEVKFTSQTNYTFCGLPGAMISFDNDTGFMGFDTDSDSKNLSVSIEPGGNVTLTWEEPASMGVGDWYEIYFSHERDGFFGTMDEDYFYASSNMNFGNNTAIHVNAQALDPGRRLYYMVVPFNASGVRGAGTYSIGIWTEEYLAQYDTIGVPLKTGNAHNVDWYCDNIPDTVGINYIHPDYGMWFWHSTRMPEGVFDTTIKMSEGYQISTSSSTKFTFVGI
jgi:parallel beta-helix repeat protein